jgi:hypothetical protein
MPKGANISKVGIFSSRLKNPLKTQGPMSWFKNYFRRKIGKNYYFDLNYSHLCIHRRES